MQKETSNRQDIAWEILPHRHDVDRRTFSIILFLCQVIVVLQLRRCKIEQV